MSVAKCNTCVEEGKEPFRIPWDEIGRALMEAHLKDVHGLIRGKDF